MKKSIYPFLLLTLLLLVSCKSKKRMVATLPRLVLNTDSIVADTSNVIAGLFAPDHSQLKDLNVSKGRKRRAKKNKSSADAYKSEDWVLRGTKITSSEVDVSSVYSGVDRVVKYDFTHRDVPEAFEGFRIAFISDLHYKSLLKEKGLNDLVRLLIAQKADGGMRDALSIFDQVVSFTNGNITYQAVIDNLNVLDYEYYFRLTDAMLSGNVRSAILILNDILSKGFDGQNIITGLASHFRDLLVCKDEATLILFEVGASIRERYKEMAKRCSDGLLFKAIELANTCDLNYRASRNKRLLLELTLIQLCQLSSAGQPADDKKKGLIEPIASNGPGQAPAQAGQAVAAQQTYTVQSAPPLQRPVQSPQEMTGATPRQQVVSTHVPPSPTLIPQAPPASAPKRVARPPQFGTSIKEIGVEHPKAQAVTQTATVVQEMQSPFSQEALVHYWDAYASAIDKKVYLKNTMINCKPALQDNYYFEVCVHNPGQQDELTNNCIDILSYLRMQLKNTRIQMRVRIDETNQKHLAYTSAEKYEHLLNINPVLAKLKDEFNLTLD